MPYGIYKTCTEEDFGTLKKRLDRLKNTIGLEFEHQLKPTERADDSEYLHINFGIATPPFFGNVFIHFLDKQGFRNFNIDLIKTYDLEGFRYYRKQRVSEDIDIDTIEKNYTSLIEKTLAIYHKWTEIDLLNSQKIEKQDKI